MEGWERPVAFPAALQLPFEPRAWKPDSCTVLGVSFPALCLSPQWPSKARLCWHCVVPRGPLGGNASFKLIEDHECMSWSGPKSWSPLCCLPLVLLRNSGTCAWVKSEQEFREGRPRACSPPEQSLPRISLLPPLPFLSFWSAWRWYFTSGITLIIKIKKGERFLDSCVYIWYNLPLPSARPLEERVISGLQTAILLVCLKLSSKSVWNIVSFSPSLSTFLPLKYICRPRSKQDCTAIQKPCFKGLYTEVLFLARSGKWGWSSLILTFMQI